MRLKSSLLMGAALILILSGLSCYPGHLILDPVHSTKRPDIKKIPPLVANINEVEEVGGVQKYIYMHLGANARGYHRGLIGYAYHPNNRKRLMAKFRVIEIYKNYSKGKILELYYSVESNSKVIIEIDNRYLYR